jgi:hypothetical protein
LPKKVEVGFVEGYPVHECTHSSHNGELFRTESLKEYNEHMKIPGHQDVNGIAPCGRCDNPVAYTSKPTGAKPFCDDCKEALRKELNL